MRLYYLLLLLSLSVSGQTQYPKDYFRSPMDLPVHPSGTFGELRTNHFHAGLDYRTNQRTGYPVYAAASGYISRIKVSSYGYGTALYIDHPNGYTTLYGHLLKYGSKIEEYVRKKQYEKKSFEIEIFPKPGEITVTQGEIVAFSGNSGGSGGPHLHFEYRDTKTEMIINPLLFGLDKKMKDPVPPKIYSVLVYPLGDNGVVDGSKVPMLINIHPQKDGGYVADKISAKGKIGFAINATDKSTGSSGNNGIYKAELLFNGSPHFSCEFNTFAFDESRYVNNYIDYERYYNTGQRYQRLFVQTPYPLTLLKHNQRNGQFEVVPGDTQNYRIEVSDYHGNKTFVNGSIQYSDAPGTVMQPKHVTPYLVKSANDNNYTKGGVSVFVPAHAFYEDFYMDFDVKDSVLYLHHPTVPVHSYVQVSFDVSHLSKNELAKTFIAGYSGKRFSYNSSFMEDGRLTAKVKTLGNFKLAKDTASPKIFGFTFKGGEWLTKVDTIGMKISDDLSGIATYDAFINGKWALMHYDHKTRTIFHNFSDGIVDEGRNELKVVVTDNVGNSTTFESHFFRTQKTNPVENDK
jgi:murein DD-endopeptidase MepM/ murein hydrolase activator NlpD